MTVLGIDPGTGRCGYAVVSFARPQKPELVTHGCFEYPSAMPIPDRLLLIERDIETVIKEHAPVLMAVETLIFNKNITTAMQVSEARGVIRLVGARHGVVLQDCTPLQVKMAITGYGRAEKLQIKQMIKLQLGLPALKGIDDAIDAFAIAITGYHLRPEKSGRR